MQSKLAAAMTLLPYVHLEQILRWKFYSPFSGVIFIFLVTATICLESVVHNVVSVSEKKKTLIILNKYSSNNKYT